MFVAGGLALLPSVVLLASATSAAYVAIAIALGVGAGCLVVDWGRLPHWTLHVTTAIGTVLIGMIVYGTGSLFYGWYFMLPVAYAALWLDRRGVLAHGVLASTVLLAPTIYEPDMVRQVARQASVAVPTVALLAAVIVALRGQLEERGRVFRRASLRDELTGVGNYRRLMSALDEATDDRRQRTFALLVCDLDRFKQINDTDGHQEGDRVLDEVADAIVDAVRGEDLVFRQGGDEFAILAPEADGAQAEMVAERIADRVGRVRSSQGQVGVTVGWAVHPEDAATAEALMGAADEHMMDRKPAGAR
ncbi:MAG: diguanylate cyclase domain-containing protein [Solirubrobacterales bacterium]